MFCSSRTDAGVHALSNVCHVDIERISKRRPGEVLPPHEPTVVQKAVNHFLQVFWIRELKTVDLKTRLTSESMAPFLSHFSATFVYSEVVLLGISFLEREHRSKLLG